MKADFQTLPLFGDSADYVQPALVHCEAEIPNNLPSGALVSVDRKNPPKIYALGFQPAKSIPEIPRWFIKNYLHENDFVLDPFAGSGTTIIECIRAGVSTLWLDYHPLSQLICSVKTRRYPHRQLIEAISRVIAHASATSFAPETVVFANKDFWFQKEVQEGLELIRDGIAGEAAEIQPVLLLAFSATVRKTSNMNDGMILAARRTNVKDVPDYSRKDVIQYFKHYALRAVQAIQEWDLILKQYPGSVTELATGDARTLSGDWKCSAVITSPPYINAIDYVWASKFELHWLGMVKTDQDRLNLYANEIGTERINTKECRELGRTGMPELDRIIEDIYTGKGYKATSGQNQLRARVVYRYFLDMKQHFAAALNHINVGGYYCFTVGDRSRICGVEVPVASLLSKLACEVGFRERFIFHLLLKNRRLNIPRNVDWAGTIKHDTTIVLEKYPS